MLFWPGLESNMETHGKYRQGEIDYEDDREYRKRWKHDAVFQILKIHFPMLYDPEVFEKPADIPPPQEGDDI
ncbi:hypothetical protein C5167_018963 [Papaver somniferum]|uniref:Uncharacterized protein n=1 Tax=Papaver somniferum TaxID=3469 RepID=A0A4Y7INS1_PAPSO|nr:hypothetical protein C5167_018963 [Papaver somniferum]